MLKKSHVAWKVSALFSAITVLVLTCTAYFNNLDDRREAVHAAREASRLQSETLILSLIRFMRIHDREGVRLLIDRIARDNPLYEDIQLIGHDGRVVLSFSGSSHSGFEQTDWPCRECHQTEEKVQLIAAGSFDRISEEEDGSQVLTLVTPIPYERDCSGADCHVDAIKERPLGFLRTDYSLRSVDTLIASHSRKTAVAVLIALLLCVAASWVAIHHLIGRRVRALTGGIRRVTDSDFNYRFDEKGHDEFSELAASLNEMTQRLSITLTQLKRTREYLEGIVEESADIIITVDPDGLIRTFNTGAERTLKYKREEVIGKRIEMLFANPEERDRAIAQLEYTDHVVNYETHFLTKDGEVRNVILTLSRLRRSDGTPVGTYGISKDITREKRLQRKLLQSEKMAALGQAITGIQHSIKNLLNVLKGGTYMVKTGMAKNDETLLKEGWDMVEEGIAHMTEMCSHMLRYARERRLKTDPTDLAMLARKIHTLSDARFQDKGIRLKLDLEDELPEVECDPELIHSVIMDLLSNALDACTWKEYQAGEEPQVVLGVRHASYNGYVQIDVQDNGEGIPEEIRGKMFTPFFSTKKRKGTGMGLAMVARAVNSHSGKITVDSEPGKGSVFRILLPVMGPRATQEDFYVEEGISS